MFYSPAEEAEERGGKTASIFENKSSWIDTHINKKGNAQLEHPAGIAQLSSSPPPPAKDLVQYLHFPVAMRLP